MGHQKLRPPVQNAAGERRGGGRAVRLCRKRPGACRKGQGAGRCGQAKPGETQIKGSGSVLAPEAARSNFDYVIIGRLEALHQSFTDLLEDMRLAFEKVHRPPRSKQDRPRERTH